MAQLSLTRSIGRRQVAHRFNCLVAGEWGSLVELWLRDKEKTAADRVGRERRRREEMVEAEREGKELEVQRREVLSLLQSGKDRQRQAEAVNGSRFSNHTTLGRQTETSIARVKSDKLQQVSVQAHHGGQGS